MQQSNSAAHDSAEDFAMLLLSFKSNYPSVYHLWAEAFPLVYNATVEELAQRGQDIEQELFY